MLRILRLAGESTRPWVERALPVSFWWGAGCMPFCGQARTSGREARASQDSTGASERGINEDPKEFPRSLLLSSRCQLCSLLSSDTGCEAALCGEQDSDGAWPLKGACAWSVGEPEMAGGAPCGLEPSWAPQTSPKVSLMTPRALGRPTWYRID